MSDESRARIRQEITDHFHDTLEARVLSGLTEDAAAKRAVEGLGDPRAARRAFRRTYLTPWQADLVRGFADVPTPVTSSTDLSAILAALGRKDLEAERKRRLFATSMMVLLVAVVTVLDLRHDLGEWQLRVGMVALMMVATIVRATTVPRLFRSGRERAAIAVGAASEQAFLGGYIIAMMHGDDSGVRFWFLVMFSVVLAACYLPLLPKLSNRREAT
jgi:MFS family permease